MTKRINPDTLATLYREAGVIPEQEVYRYLGYDEDGPTYACGLGVAYYAATGYTTFPDEVGTKVGDMLGISDAYHLGYVHGFDGKPIDSLEIPSSDYVDGYHDGMIGWHAIQHLVPADETDE